MSLVLSWCACGWSIVVFVAHSIGSQPIKENIATIVNSSLHLSIWLLQRLREGRGDRRCGFNLI